MDIEAALEKEAKQKLAEFEGLKAGVEEARNAWQRADKALKAYKGEPMNPPRTAEEAKETPSPNGNGYRWTVSDGILDNVMAAARKLSADSPGGKFFEHELREESGNAEATVKNALEELRKQKKLRKAGVRDAGPRRGTKDVYAIDEVTHA